MSDPNFSSSDAATSSSFGSAAVAGDELCETDPVVTKPCDIEEVILNEINVSRSTTYKKVNGTFKADPVTASQRAISLCGVDASAPKRPALEVVADKRGRKVATRIRAHVQTLAAHDNSHALVIVDRPGQSDLVKHCPASDVIEFDVFAKSLGDGEGGIFDRYFPFADNPNRYRINVDSCGIRNSGKAVGSGHLDVLVYPMDQYMLKISVPPLKKLSYSRSRTHTITGDQIDKRAVEKTDYATGTETIKKEDGTVIEKRETTVDGVTVKRLQEDSRMDDGTSLTFVDRTAEDAEPDKASIEFKINGSELDVVANLNEILKAAQKVAKGIEGIRELVKDWVPQMGWKFDAGISFMSGELSMTWGWREYKDHRVYFGWSAAGSITIFSISLSASFGIKAGPATARILAEVSDAGLKLETEWDLTRPERNRFPDKASASMNIPVELRGEATVSLTVTKWERAAGLRSGFSVEGGFRWNDPNTELYAKIELAPLDFFVRKQNIGEKPVEDVYNLTDKHTIHEGAIPL